MIVYAHIVHRYLIVCVDSCIHVHEQDNMCAQTVACLYVSGLFPGLQTCSMAGRGRVGRCLYVSGLFPGLQTCSMAGRGRVGSSSLCVETLLGSRWAAEVNLSWSASSIR